MGLIYKLTGENIFIEPIPVPSQQKTYAIYVYKDRLKEIKEKFKKINEKVSDKSDYKELSKILMDENKNNWNKGKPKGWNAYPDKNDKKYFCELSIDDIANLKNILDAYKSKLFKGWKLILHGKFKDKEIKTFSETKKSIKQEALNAVKQVADEVESKLKSKFFSKPSGKNETAVSNEGEKITAEKLSKASEEQRNEAKNKYKGLLDKSLEEFDKKINDGIKELIDNVNSMPSSVKIQYNENCIYSSQKRNSKSVLDQITNFMRLNKNSADVVKVLDDWNQTVGVKLFSRDKSLGTLNKYIEAGYNVISILGSGGAAMVVKIINKKGKERALKIFNNKDEFSDYQDEKSAIERMKSVDKKKVKKYFNAPKIDKKGNMKMKLAKKVLDSDEFINRGDNDSNLKASFFRRMARQVLKGLESLNSQGLIHGDIKPDNIHMVASKKVDKNGKSKKDRFKIADLGTVSSASSGEMMGTSIYIHPNCTCHSSPDQRMKNDVYALGCSLLDILIGRRVENYINFLKDKNENICKKISSKYKKMNEDAINSVLNFIRKLCQEDLNKVPMAKEALKDSFLKKQK